MLRTLSVTLTMALLSFGSVAAQEQTGPAQATPTQKPNAQEVSPGPRGPGQPVNIKLDLTITDQAGAGEPSKKVITLIVADQQNGYIRSKGNVWITERRGFNVTINVDARPVILREGLVRVDLALEYQPTPPAAGSATAVTADATNLNQRIGVILHEGKPLVISQAVDPASDRKISVELKATILK